MTAVMAPSRRMWSTWRELPGEITAPANVKRSVGIALVIGTLFVAVNKLGLILSGHATFIGG